MTIFNLPSPLDNVFADLSDLSLFFDRLMVGLVDLLNCDCCYLYLHDPQLCVGQIRHFHSTHPELPNIIEDKIQTRNAVISNTNPLFLAALNCRSTIFIENFEKAIFTNPELILWSKNHPEYKSLAQAHLCLGKDLWGIIQVSQFDRPRPWTKFDRGLISLVVDKITPLTSVYSRRELRGTVQYLYDGYGKL